MAETSSAGSVQSVTRAFALLEAIAEAEGGLPLAIAAERTGLPVPTAHRLLGTMQRLRYVHQTEQRRYALGAGLIGLGKRAVPPLADIASPFLERLEEEFNETANLAVLDGDLVLYVAQTPSRHRMRIFTEIGRRVLPHSTGVGKAMLSLMPEDRVEALVERTGLPRFTPATLVTVDTFMADLRLSKRRGFAADDSEQEVGVRCIAVAAPGLDQPTAISVSGPVTRVTSAVVPSLVKSLKAAAEELRAAAMTRAS